MAFRTIVIDNRCKLDYSLNYMICRKANEEVRVVLDEIKTIIINTTQVSITTYLISELISKKIKVIFTDTLHNPVGEITPYSNNFYLYRKIKEQMAFTEDSKNYLWKEIVKKKIINQSRNLKYNKNIEAEQQLIGYYNEVLNGDISNREGHAAKVYFNALFGKVFSRHQDNNINAKLNYGYAIIMSTINREIKALGYLTELGIHHIGESNPFNLSCDFIEPLRPLVDLYIISGQLNDNNYKERLVGLLSKKVLYQDKEIFLDNAIRLYVEDLLMYLRSGDISKIRFIKYEL